MASLRARLGAAIRMLRESAGGLSQEKLALRVGLSPTFVGEIERAEKACSVDSLELIAEALRIPAWRIVQEAEVLAEPPSERGTSGQGPGGARPPSRRFPRVLAFHPPVGETPPDERTLRPSPASATGLQVLLVVEPTLGGFTARAPDLPECQAFGTSAETAEQELRTLVATRLEQQPATSAAVTPPPASYAKLIDVSIRRDQQ